MKNLKLYWPLRQPTISQHFGQNLIPLYKELGMMGHNGMDMPCPTGEPIYAAHDGIVVFTETDSRGGYGVVLRTIEPYDYKGTPMFFKTIYWHILPTIPVATGAQVKIGDLIGYGDSTGAATGSHLHFGLKPILQGENEWTWMNAENTNGYFGAIDPEPYLQSLTAYQLRTSLQAIGEILKSISAKVAWLIKNKKSV